MTKRAARTRVLIVEDHPVLRGVVRLACEHSADLEVVGEVAEGEAALAAARELAPDVVVLDLTLPGELQGIDVVRALREEAPTAKILVLTGRTDDRAIFETMRLGVDGYLDKTAGVRFIPKALSRVVAGERVFTPHHERAAREELVRMARRAREAADARANLTKRENQILQFISLGLAVKQVAKRLGVSPRTVETHIATLYRKLGVKNRVQAIAKASSLGLIHIT